MPIDNTDAAKIRIGVLGTSVDDTLNAATLPTTWTSSGPLAGRNVLDDTVDERIINRAINELYDRASLTSTATNGFAARFSNVVGAETGADQAAFAAIGKTLIRAVHDLMTSSGDGGPVNLGGDVTGAASANTVARLRGRNIGTGTPTNGQVLAWSQAATQWQPTTVEGVGGGGEIQFLQTVSQPWFYRLPNPFGTHWARGIARAWGYSGLALTSADTVWVMTNANGPPNIDGTWASVGASPVSFSTGYIGAWRALPPSSTINQAIVFFNKTSTALLCTITFGTNPAVSHVTMSALTLAGLPSGFDVIAMWASGRNCYVICNNRLFHCGPVPTTSPFTSAVFNEITGVPELTAITTKTRVHVERNGTTSEHRVLVWGTAPADKAALYDSETDTWTEITTPADHNGGANAMVVFLNGKIGFLNPSTRAYATAEPGDDYATWTTRYTLSSSNRRLISIDGTVPQFIPSSAATTYDVESFQDVAFEALTAPAPAAGSSNFPFASEYLSPGDGAVTGVNTVFLSNAASASANAGYMCCYMRKVSWVTVFGNRSFNGIAEISSEYLYDSSVFVPTTVVNSLSLPTPPGMAGNRRNYLVSEPPSGFSGSTMRRTQISVGNAP